MAEREARRGQPLGVSLERALVLTQGHIVDRAASII